MPKPFKEKITTLKDVLKFFYGRYTFWVVLRDILFLIITVGEMYNIKVMGDFLDGTAELLLNMNEFSFKEYFFTDSFFFLIMSLILWIAISVGNKVRANIYENMYEKVWADCGQDVVSAISKSNLQDVIDPKYQDLVTYVPAYAINNLVNSYLEISEIISQSIRLISALTIMFIDIRFAVFLLIIFVLPEVLVTFLQRNKIAKYNINQVSRLKYINYISSLASNLFFFTELRVNEVFSFLKRSYKKESDEYLKGLFERNKHFYIDSIATSVIDQIIKYLFIIYLVGYSIMKRITIGSFSALFNYTNLVYDSSFNLFNSLALLNDSLTYAEKYFELVKKKGFGDIEYGEKKLPRGPVSLEFKNLTFSYPDEPERVVLENINMKIEAGEKVLILGGDGSGKTSIVKLLTGLYAIQEGDFLINDISIRDLARGELKGKMSLTFQNFINYNFTIEENITIGTKVKKVNKKLLEGVIRVSGVGELLKKEKIGTDAILGNHFQDGRELSPGYWQRLAIARMLYRNKEVFIMDEAFTFIGTQSKKIILDRILKFVGKERTLIYITRDVEFLDVFDRVFFFDKGHVKEIKDIKHFYKTHIQ
jgi:ABC-type multidrug transport system fused ATPase/permease subunit